MHTSFVYAILFSTISQEYCKLNTFSLGSFKDILRSTFNIVGEGVYGDQAAVLVRLDEVVYVADLFSGDLSPLTGASGYSSRAISARPSAVETLGKTPCSLHNCTVCKSSFLRCLCLACPQDLIL